MLIAIIVIIIICIYKLCLLLLLLLRELADTLAKDRGSNMWGVPKYLPEMQTAYPARRRETDFPNIFVNMFRKYKTHPLYNYNTLYSIIILRLPQMPKSSMSNSKKVHEGKNTKGTLAKGHLCAYPNTAQTKLKDLRARRDGRGLSMLCMLCMYVYNIYIYIYTYLTHI